MGSHLLSGVPPQDLTGALVRLALSTAPGADPAAAALAILRHADASERFLPDATDALLTALDAHRTSATVTAWLQEPARGPNAEHLRATLLTALGDHARALPAWDAVIEHAVGPRPSRHLARGRARLAAVDVLGAALDLREAFREPARYEDMERGHKLLARLRKSGVTLPTTRKLRLAILGTSNTQLLKPLLDLACFRDNIDVTLYESDYGQATQEVLDTHSGLHAFKPDVVLFPTTHHDAALPPISTDADAAVARLVDPITSLWASLRAAMPVHIIQHTFDVPVDDNAGLLGSLHPGGRTRILQRANLDLLQKAGSGVSLLDLDAVARECGRESFVDHGLWYRVRQHPAPAALPTLVEHQMRHVRAVLGLTRKVLVLDLDNTLWGGVVGEEGPLGVRLGAPDADGEAHQDLQRAARELKDRGIVLGVCSKNNDADAREPFTRNPEMVLKLEDVAVFRANWQDKATNLREMAAALELGTDSLVFLDDNPAERAWVRQQMPEVSVPEVGSDPTTYAATLARAHVFDALTLSEEDRLRAADYAANAQRSELQRSSGTMEDFIRNLQMTATIAEFNAPSMARVAQLVNKSNQFNLTTRRYTEEQLRRFREDTAGHVTRSFRLKDRFADNGLIGVMIGVVHADRAELVIDSWLMSCRVLGRRVEELMAGEMVDVARARGLARVTGTYIPTAKNALVKDLYARLGFTLERTDEATGATHWSFAVSAGASLGNTLVVVEREPA
jgi:FkbH-like protein